MRPSVDDIVKFLMLARGCADAIAEEIASSEPRRARVLTDFSEELWKVWEKYAARLLPPSQTS